LGSELSRGDASATDVFNRKDWDIGRRNLSSETGGRSDRSPRRSRWIRGVL